MFHKHDQYGLFRFIISQANPGGEMPSYGQGLCLRAVEFDDGMIFIHCIFWDDDNTNFGYVSGREAKTKKFYSMPYRKIYPTD